MKNQARSAFTLFQLLVLLAILALLLALLLPAIQKVRAAAGRAQAQNNLKQLAVAIHNHESALMRLPAGCDDNNYSATAHLLPFVEQDNLYNLIDFKKPMADKANDAARKTRIALFLSPLDPRQAVTDDLGATNYLFCAGSKPALEKNDGVFYLNSKPILARIEDGTSNTIMAGETLKGDGGTKALDMRRQHVRLNKDALKDLKDEAGVAEWNDNKSIVGDRGASWMDGRFLQGTFNSGRMPNDERPDVSCDGLGGLSGLRSLNEFVSIAMCDGSVRSVSTRIEAKTWKALTTAAGGEVVNDF